ncbi:efflux RND transporter periplasmic adaptor subunit [Sulfuricystis thermophila]|uniref:efflux RND transporter periplasmic adaptor subunit n=1 Tax=Sulfuricystis thermophila TaxID=2496847 RepID=UPI0010366698|nr:efflux RND transporter periplasmic adaptor subunit [Sulfuricystis thermophila]
MRSLLIFAALSWFAVAQAAEEALVRITPEQAARMGIVVQPLGQKERAGTLRLPAQVVIPPGQIEVVTAPLPAMVARVAVAYGEPVAKGQPLVRLQGAAFLEAQRAFVESKTQAALAEENRRRDEALFQDGIISQARLSATRAAEREALARLDERRQALRLANLPPAHESGTTSDTVWLRAPFAGVVLEAPVQAGQRVDAQMPLVKLARIAPLWLEIQASATQAAGIAPGDTVMVPGCAKRAQVKLIAPQLQMASQSVVIRAELADPAGCVKPFQFVEAQLAKERQAGSIAVPVAALVRHQGKSWLFVATDGGFRPEPVEVVAETAEVTRIATSLPREARIAVKGAAAIKAVWLGLGAAED